MEAQDITILIRNKINGNCVFTTQRSFGLLSNRDEWEVLEPEHQRTPAPAGQAIRASDLPGSAPIVDNPPEPVTVETQTPEPQKRKRGRKHT